jgi:uncharacterized membrane protein YsdA (DUF1294 family)
MSNISKLIGGIVGGIVGMIVLFVNNQWGFDISGVTDTVVNTLVPLVTGWIGVYFAPKNTPA